MDIMFCVNRVSTHSVEVPVQYNGEEARAMLPETEVELYDDKTMHGSLTLHFRSQAEIAEARTMFVAGSMVKLSFSQEMVISTEADPVVDAPA